VPTRVLVLARMQGSRRERVRATARLDLILVARLVTVWGRQTLSGEDA
jgi:hypothetical protein